MKLHIMYTYMSFLRKKSKDYMFFKFILKIINLLITLFSLIKNIFLIFTQKNYSKYIYNFGTKDVIFYDRNEINNKHLFSLLNEKRKKDRNKITHKNKKKYLFLIDSFADILGPQKYSLLHKRQNYLLSKQIIYLIKKNINDGIILFDTSDSNEDVIPILCSHGIDINKIKIYFKREKLIGKKYIHHQTIALPHLFPITGLSLKKKFTVNEKYYLSFGGLMTGVRNNTINEIQKHFGKKFNFYSLPYSKHIETLDQSKFSINLHGGGEVCYRFDEIAHSKSLMICQKFNIEMPNNFTDMENIIFFTSIQELNDKLKNIDNEKYKNIFINFKKHYLKFHSSSYRINFIENRIKVL